MNSKSFAGLDNRRKPTNFDILKKEYDSIKDDILRIKEMEVSEESKKPILEELEKQVNEVKEKMHNYIDTF